MSRPQPGPLQTVDSDSSLDTSNQIELETKSSHSLNSDTRHENFNVSSCSDSDENLSSLTLRRKKFTRMVEF